MSRVRRDSVRISSTARAGFHAEPGRVPRIGDTVYCVEGEAQVTRILGKVSDGSRLLELNLSDQTKAPFFAASSNVLVRDGET